MTFVCSEIFSIIVSRNNPLTRKIRADDKAFLLSGREITGRTLGLPRSCLRKKEKQEEKEAQGRKKGRKKRRGREIYIYIYIGSKGNRKGRERESIKKFDVEERD